MSARDQPHAGETVTVVVVLVVLLLQEHLQGCLVDAPRVVQQGLEPVTHLAIEGVVGEVFPADLPVVRSQLMLHGDRQSVLAHEGVVGRLDSTLLALVRAVLERPVVRQRLARLGVVVDDEDVVVRLTTLAVEVSDHQDIGMRVHSLGEQVPQVVHPLDRQRVGRVELLAAETLPVVEHFDFAIVRLGQRSSASREGAGTPKDIARNCRATFIVETPDIRFGCGRRSRR